MSCRWTAEARARQAELIKTWRPWERSTGPRTSDGKAKVALNAWKGGKRPALEELSKLLSEALRHHAETLQR